MALPRILVLVLAGGAGGRLELLTEQRAKPAVPFAGVYRLIDFPLSNCQHSQIADVWVSVQFHPTSLSDHLANGRPWDLDRTAGGLLTLPPFQGTDRGGWHTGTADSLWRQADLIRELTHMHRTRHETFLHGSPDALREHSSRLAALEGEYLRRHPTARSTPPEPARVPGPTPQVPD